MRTERDVKYALKLIEASMPLLPKGSDMRLSARECMEVVHWVLGEDNNSFGKLLLELHTILSKGVHPRLGIIPFLEDQ